MKQAKKLLSFVLVLALSLSLTGGMSAKAAATVTVTLRLEQDGATLLPPVSVTLTEADKDNDFGIGLSTGADAAQSPLRAYAKYLSEKGVSNEDMKKYIIASPSDYGLFVTGLSATGDGVGSATVKDVNDVYWKYNVNDAEGAVSMDQYDLKDSDSVVIYGLWWSDKEETLYSAFDKSVYETENNSVTITLTGYGTSYDENFNPTPYTKPIAGAKISVALVTPDHAQSVPEGNAAITSETSADGTVTIAFPQSDKDETYVLTASKYAADGVHNTISRPYALVKVPAKISNPKPEKPAKVKSLKAVVKKSKKAKKTIALSWKKVSNADGYQVYVSTKKKTGYKKAADVKKASATIKRKKGTYYIKVRSYKKSEGKKTSGSFSSICRVKVK